MDEGPSKENGHLIGSKMEVKHNKDLQEKNDGDRWKIEIKM